MTNVLLQTRADFKQTYSEMSYCPIDFSAPLCINLAAFISVYSSNLTNRIDSEYSDYGVIHLLLLITTALTETTICCCLYIEFLW